MREIELRTAQVIACEKVEKSDKLLKETLDIGNGQTKTVCSGIAKYFDIDPTIVRLALVLFCALGGSGVLAYIICAIVFPDEPGYTEEE